MTASIFKKIYSCGEMRNKMKKFSIMALTIGAIALAAVAVFKIFGKKSSCCKYSDDDFDDDFDDYDFETDCCADDELEVVIPAEENDETVEVKVEEKSEEAPEEEEAPSEEVPVEETPAEEKTEE